MSKRRICPPGSLTLYPEGEKPMVGNELNRPAVITLHVRPPYCTAYCTENPRD